MDRGPERAGGGVSRSIPWWSRLAHPAADLVSSVVEEVDHVVRLDLRREHGVYVQRPVVDEVQRLHVSPEYCIGAIALHQKDHLPGVAELVVAVQLQTTRVLGGI